MNPQIYTSTYTNWLQENIIRETCSGESSCVEYGTTKLNGVVCEWVKAKHYSIQRFTTNFNVGLSDIFKMLYIAHISVDCTKLDIFAITS